MRDLDHPNVVQILDGGLNEDGDLFLVFERLYGQSLEGALQQRRVTPRSLLRIAIRLLDALGTVHEHGWVHRDVKPANVFLARDTLGATVVKLIDFGIAARSGPASAAMGPVLGTVEYMSPEQSEGAALDGRSDLWSVGALLFRGLTGAVPYPPTRAGGRARPRSASPQPLCDAHGPPSGPLWGGAALPPARAASAVGDRGRSGVRDHGDRRGRARGPSAASWLGRGRPPRVHGMTAG